MRALAALSLVVTTALACKPPDNSELLYGHLNDIRYPGRLILATPGQTISFCGDFTAEAVNATRQWATAAGRASRLTIDGNCTSTTYQWRITNFRSSQADCRRHFPNGDAGAYTDVTQKHIAFCAESNDRNALATLLHEIGHAWGMCDQYTQNVGNGNSNNCDPNNHSPGGRVTSSVMGASYALTLAQDDQDGIRALAARSDVPGSDQWRNASVQTPSAPAVQAPSVQTPATAPSVQPPRPPQQAPSVTPSSSGSGLLDCNADFSKITAGGIGVCVNRSSGYAFCYRYANGNVAYQQNVPCPAGGSSPQVSAPSVAPSSPLPRPQPQPSAPSVQPPSPPPSSGGAVVACGCLRDVSGQCFLTKGTQRIPVGGPTGSCAQTCVNKAAANGCRY